jgi:D-proline reductase (dithiol) PrdB
MDPYRYLTFSSRTIMQSWTAHEHPPDVVAWAPINKPLDQCRVALISSAGVALRTDKPFDKQGERDNPFWGDPSWRELPCGVGAADVTISHLHIDPTPALQDIDVVLPVHRLGELVADGVVGAINSRHFSIMGYQLDATELVTSTAPQLAAALAADAVDLAVLVPV